MLWQSILEAGIHPVLNLKPCYFLVVTLHWRGAQSVSQAAADDQNVAFHLLHTYFCQWHLITRLGCHLMHQEGTVGKGPRATCISASAWAWASASASASQHQLELERQQPIKELSLTSSQIVPTAASAKAGCIRQKIESKQSSIVGNARPLPKKYDGNPQPIFIRWKYEVIFPGVSISIRHGTLQGLSCNLSWPYPPIWRFVPYWIKFRSTLKVDVLLPGMLCLCMTDTARRKPEGSEAGTVFFF